jgi:ribonucleoside-diphosphate reductase alpha chain
MTKFPLAWVNGGYYNQWIELGPALDLVVAVTLILVKHTYGGQQRLRVVTGELKCNLLKTSPSIQHWYQRWLRAASSPVTAASDLGDYRIIRRNGAVVAFEPSKIAVAMTKAFLAVNGGQGAASARIRELVEQLTASVVSALVRRQPSGGTFHIEDVQDQVELALMRSGEHDVARAYVLYRAKQMEERRAAKEARRRAIAAPQIHVLENGERKPLELGACGLIGAACRPGKHVDADAIVAETLKNLYDGVPVEELHKSAILAARALMEKDPAYSQVTARILLHTIRKEVFGKEVAQPPPRRIRDYFPQYIAKGIAAELLDTKLAEFDLARLAKAIVADRDLQFGYLGLQTLYDRYFLHVATSASKCRRPSTCAWPWAWR